jgi:Domain of unknown function (DUF3943)
MAMPLPCRAVRFERCIHSACLLLCAAVMSTASLSHAEEPEYRAQLKLPVLASTDDAAPRTATAKPKLDWETGAGKSYWIPALDIVGFDVLLNQFDRHFIDEETYGSDIHSIRNNLHGPWVFDNDPFSTNQFLHPYQGSMYHGFARSVGLNYWEALLYTFAGSAFWEIAGETTPPSKNDQIATGIGGTFLGEPLFRMASLLLESADGTPSFWRELGAAVISPSTGFNRLAYGDRFDAVFPSHHPAYYSRLQLGEAYTDHIRDQGVTQPIQHAEGQLDFALSYGLPGKADYAYTRPFDYFNFQLTASTANILENILSRGLLIGTDYAAGKNYRGAWGLYGSYDYISPQTFRVSSTAVSLGTTAQWWLSKSIALQYTALAGVGYAAAGTIHGSGERDYHYGATPQALLDANLIFSQRANLDIAAREYYVSSVASPESRGFENITRLDTTFTLRVKGHHAIAVKYVLSHREAHYPDLGDRHQTMGTIGLYYSWISDKDFGAVEWRDAVSR